jgi:hypothetical protein
MFSTISNAIDGMTAFNATPINVIVTMAVMAIPP